MSKILLIGNSGDKSKSTDGQVAKVRLYRELILKEKGELTFVDLEGFLIHPIRTLFMIKKGIKRCDRIILLAAQRGSRILIPFINFLNRKSNKPFIFPMIGINILHKYVDRLNDMEYYNFMFKHEFGSTKPSKQDIRNFSKISVILAENYTVCNLIKDFFGLNNVDILNNFRCDDVILNKKLIATNNLRLIFLSRVMKEKGIFNVMNATNELLKEGHNISLDIFGKKYFNDSENLEFESQLNKMICYKGEVPNSKAIEVISNYDVFVFPTLYRGEGTPGVISEALIAGVPIISSDFAQASDLLTKGIDSLLYNSNSIKELKNAIIFFTNKINRETFKKNAIKSGYKFTYKYNREIFIKYIFGNSDED